MESSGNEKMCEEKKSCCGSKCCCSKTFVAFLLLLIGGMVGYVIGKGGLCGLGYKKSMCSYSMTKPSSTDVAPASAPTEQKK